MKKGANSSKNLVISVIIPAFNAEKYLERCLKSVSEALSGTLGEVLVVDNGSTDKTLNVARKCQILPNMASFRVIHCDIPGAAAARNLGASQALGKYIWFIDADDYIAETSISKLLATAEKDQADLVMMGASRMTGKRITSYLSAVKPDEADFKSRFVRYGMGPWQVLIRRSWWEKNNFRFREGIIHEDMELMSALILCTDKFAAVDEPLYFYCNNPESVLHKSKFDAHIFDIFAALEGLYERFESAGADNQYHDELEWFFIWNLLIDSAKDFGSFKEGRSGFRRSRKMLRKYFPKWYKNRFLRQKPLKLQLRVWLNYFGG